MHYARHPLLRHAGIVCLLSTLSAGPAQARMYQWVDTQTGTVQLSGAPPAWYRSTQSGPRVFVFENGRLVDDTARELPAEQSALLRATALGASVPTTPLLTVPVLTSDAPPPPALPSPAVAVPPPIEDSTSRQIAEFKALLDAYDRAQESVAHDRLATPPAP